MSEVTVLIRDRKTRRIVAARTRPEPVKVRVCRTCNRVHPPVQAGCAAA